MPTACAAGGNHSTKQSDGIPARVCRAVARGFFNLELLVSSESTAVASLPEVVLRPRRALPFFSGHPWVFAGAIGREPAGLEPGTEVRLVSSRDEFVARGLYNPHSNIRVRLYSWDADRPLDAALWSERLDSAIALRKKLFPDFNDTSARRLVFSEADGLSGLTVDQYGPWLLMQVTSLALSKQVDVISGLLQQKLKPAGIWLRTEKGIGEAEQLELTDGLLLGERPPRPLFLEEQGIRFGVDVTEGQKTGFFLDQRENRAAAARYTGGARVLDVCCYTGGFGLHAAIHGKAREVVGIDSSEGALTVARANAELNSISERVRFVKGDAFDTLTRFAQEGQRFDVVILDPPKLARHRAGLKRAMKAYHNLNRSAVALLNPNGILVTCSCSGLVDRALFEEMLAGVATETKRPIQILEARGQAPDHPVSVFCRENEYLKCHICRVA